MKKPYLIGVFDDEAPLFKAVKNVRDEGLKIANVYTPFPVHGLDDAMGMKMTRIPRAGFLMGFFAALSALAFMGYVFAIDYPLNIGGKPVFPLPSLIPITFEATVLVSGVGMVIVFFIVNSLVPSTEGHPVHERATHDKFIMVMSYKDDSEKSKIEAMLKDSGAEEVNEKELSI